MKYLKFLGMALIAIIMSIGFVACGSDDDNDNNNPQPTNPTTEVQKTLFGTTWKITTCVDKDFIGVVCTFNSDNTMIFNPSKWSKTTYSVSDGNLKLVVDKDEYMVGPLTVNNTTASYQYKWYDHEGKPLYNGRTFNMTLVKQ